MKAQGRMMCPVCEVPLSMADRQGVEIDFCPECRGVWLDRGELDKIIERSATEMSVPPRERDRRGHDEDRGRGYGKHGGGHQGGYGGSHGSRRKSSWLMDLFD